MTGPEICVLVPTRGRPQAVPEMAAAWKATQTSIARLIFIIDDDDPTLQDYEALPTWRREGPLVTYMIQPSQGNMVGALNAAARLFAPDFRYVGFMGDDHRPRTLGWDKRVIQRLGATGTGILSGPDGYRRDHLPTWCVMTSDIIQAVGYMAPPTLRHMYVDNAWQALGEALGCYTYDTFLLVEHMHPIAGKAPVDEGYARVNAPEVYAIDADAYDVWLRESLPDAVWAVKRSTVHA